MCVCVFVATSNSTGTNHATSSVTTQLTMTGTMRLSRSVPVWLSLYRKNVLNCLDVELLISKINTTQNDLSQNQFFLSAICVDCVDGGILQELTKLPPLKSSVSSIHKEQTSLHIQILFMRSIIMQ